MVEPYNEAVRRHFANPLHAGDLQPGYPDVVTAEASASDSGFRVMLAAQLDGRIMRQLRYRVFGCPHLLAAAEESLSRCEGRPVEALQQIPMAELIALLEVPVEKTGRILLLEDALSALANAIRMRAA